MDLLDFPGGPVVKNLLANQGNMSSIPGPGRFHMLQSSKVHEPQLLSPCSATEVTATESSPHLLQLEKA